MTKPKPKRQRRVTPALPSATPRVRAREAGGKIASADAAYRKALGVEVGTPLPSKLGNSSSAGSARGGRGSAQKGKGLRK